MITQLTGDIGQDMFRIATGSIWAWEKEEIMVFEGGTLYNESLYRNLTFTEPLDNPEILPDTKPVIADYLRYRDQIRNLFSIHSDTIEQVVAYAVTLPEAPITVINTSNTTSEDYIKTAISTIGTGVFIVTGDVQTSEQDVDTCPLTEPEQILTLMIGADNLIISDSDLSWWGAFLNCREDAKIICPTLTNNMICDNWIVL